MIETIISSILTGLFIIFVSVLLVISVYIAIVITFLLLQLLVLIFDNLER